MKKAFFLLLLSLSLTACGTPKTEEKSGTPAPSTQQSSEVESTFTLDTKEKAIKFWHDLYEHDKEMKMPWFVEGDNLENAKVLEQGKDFITLDARAFPDTQKNFLAYTGVWIFRQIENVIEIKIFGVNLYPNEDPDKIKTAEDEKEEQEWLIAHNYPNGGYIKILANLETFEVLENVEVDLSE